jgi:hypothetical protein
MHTKNFLSNKVLDRMFCLNRKISQKTQEIAQIPTLPYYKLFQQTGLIQSDIQAQKKELKDLYDEKLSAIDTLIQQAEMEKITINERLRNLTIEINSESNGIIHQ